jgi:beta-galactosidase
MAISIDEIDDGSGMQDVSDIIGFNLYFGWYYRTLEGLGAYLDSLHARHPTRPLMVSEYGAGSDERIHTTSPVAFDFSTEHQQRFHELQFPQMRARAYLIGTAVWNQFDFGSKGRHDSKPNLNQKGLIYFDRKPKDLWYYYRALLVQEPVLHIAVRDWPRRAGTRAADARQDVVTYTNADEVELFANGETLGVQPVENAMARWTATLRAGQNRLEARAGGGATDVAFVHYEDRAAPGSIAVNAGSHYQYIDAGGVVWEADRPYEPGGWGHVGGGEPRLRHHRIFGSREDGLYQAQREGAEQYRFDVPDGSYEVRLLFTENELDQPGKRVFNVEINGVIVLRDLDLVAAYGRYAAVDRTAITRAEDGTGVVVRLQPTAGQATISGVMLRKL